MSLLALNISDAHKFVREQRRLGSDVRWDGWDMVFWKPTHYGFTHKSGAYRNNRWGVETRVSVDTDGKWRIAPRNVKPIR